MNINLRRSPWKREALERLARGSEAQRELTGKRYRSVPNDTTEYRRQALFQLLVAGLVTVAKGARGANIWTITTEGRKALEAVAA